MASLLKHLSLLFLVLSLFSSIQTEARVSKFFSKFIHTTDNIVSEPTTVPSSSPVSSPLELSPTPAPALAPSPEAEPFFYQSQNSYGLYGHDHVADQEEKPTLTDVEEEILGEDTTDEKYNSGHRSNPDENGGYEENYKEREGMSDTRFMEKGKYYYDGNEERNGEKYFDGYGSRSGSYYYGSNNNNKNRYEFDSMEEYENYENQKRHNFTP